VPTMIVLVNLREGTDPEDYERWIEETYSPAVMNLKSVDDWRGYRVGGLLESGAAPPCQYVVLVEVNDPEQLGQDIQSEEVQRLLAELGRFAEPPTQLITERFV
jgi:hypothetical protein